MTRKNNNRAFVTQGNIKRQKPVKTPRKSETKEERRARGYALRGTPMARDLEESVRRRIEAMK